MAIDNKIWDGKLQYDIKKMQQKYQQHHLEKLMNMYIFQVKKYCILIKGKQ